MLFFVMYLQFIIKYKEDEDRGFFSRFDSDHLKNSVASVRILAEITKNR